MQPSQSFPTPSVEEYITALKNSSKFGPQVVYQRKFTAVPPRFATHGTLLSTGMQKCLETLGIPSLYSHQERCIQELFSGKDILVCTPTSSGKSLVYNVPVFERILQDTNSHALYLFPLKALAQDQYHSIIELNEILTKEKFRDVSEVAAIYDGDTSPYRRRKLRESPPKILISNPEMLHLSFLPFHESWANFFSKLDYVIIDEVHTYRGIFGSHVAWLIRRLKRVLEHYGKKTQFILSSATIGNPKSFGEKLIGEEIEVITETGAPLSQKKYIFINPWDSAAYTASQLLEAAMKRGLRTIVYTQSRKMTELISLWTRPRLGDLSGRLSSYRAGFLPEERRDIEAKMSDGSLLGVISTSALELGIDIGDLDICILVGYPGSLMATYQRGGRVGRGGRESAVILIASEDALDQYYMKNPENFFHKDVESAVLNPQNLTILKEHLICAAAEIPLKSNENLLQRTLIKSTADELVAQGKLLQAADGTEYYSSRKRPQRNVSLRGGGENLTIINGDTGLILGEIDASRALKECHEGAVYLHRVTTWLVEKLDLMSREVVVREKKPSYYTKPLSNKDTEILSVQKKRNIFGCQLSYGKLKVKERVTGYQKRNSGTNTLISTIPLDLPEQTLETEGFWLEIPGTTTAFFEKEQLHFMGGLHALEHLLISVFPFLVLCDRNDVGGISCPQHQQTVGATIFVYDGHAGGSGLAEEAYLKAEELLKRGCEIVVDCECENGCPACVHSPKCGSGNRPIDKTSCITLIKKIISSQNTDKAAGNELSEDKNFNSSASLHFGNTSKGKGLDILPERWGVFDLETKYSADEVGGWHKAEKMEVSVAVIYDSQLDGFATYFEDEVDKLILHLTELELIVGFNNKRFDNRVLIPYTNKDLNRLPTLDLLEEISNYLGYRLSLNAVAEHTLGVKKSGDGLQALQWYKDGELEKIAKYCKKDVDITRKLFLYGLENGFFIFQNKAKKKVRLPLHLEKTVLTQLNP